MDTQGLRAPTAAREPGLSIRLATEKEDLRSPEFNR
jgi:hypothetical protein